MKDGDELLLALAVGLEVVLLRLGPPQLLAWRGVLLAGKALPALPAGEAGCEADSMSPLLLLLLVGVV